MSKADSAFADLQRSFAGRLSDSFVFIRSLYYRLSFQRRIAMTRTVINRLLGVRAVFAGALAGAALSVASSHGAARYDPDTPPTCTFTHTTQATLPANRDRTDIAIGEPVDFSISNWSDHDWEIDDQGRYSDIWDGMKSVAWTVTGPGSVYPTAGVITTYTAPILNGSASATVDACLLDSGIFGRDAPLHKRVDFNIVIPTGVKVWFNCDNPYSTQNPNGVLAGASSSFDCQIQPDTVNFSHVSIREIADTQTFPDWPNGTPSIRNGFTHPPGCPADHAVGGTLMPNMVFDVVGEVWDRYLLYDGSGYQAYVCLFHVQWQFSGISGSWRPITTVTHDRIYMATTSQCHIKYEADNVERGGDQGPWDR